MQAFFCTTKAFLSLPLPSGMLLRCLHRGLPADIITLMGRSRRKQGYGTRRPEKEYGRSRGRESSGAGTVIIIAAAVFLLLAAAFLYLRNDPAFDGLFRKKAPETSSSSVPEDLTAASSPETEFSLKEVQSITVTVPETESETPSPPKYQENENTKLIERFRDGSGNAERSDDVLGNAVTVTFAGDILFDDHYAVMASAISRTKGDPTADVMFDEGILSIMRSSDIFMVNNEFPYSKGGQPLKDKKYTFRADPKYASLLFDMGADIVALANNHLYDHGEEAFLDTLSTLKNVTPGTKEEEAGPKTGIPYVGAGVNIDEASRPFYFTTGNIRIGFIAATQIERMENPDTKGATEASPGVFRCLNYEKLCGVIGDMRGECDFVIAYLHWGTESTQNVDHYQKELALAVRNAGADLIIGDHPHVLQEISVLDPLKEGSAGVPCIYSLGNFLFNSNAQDTCLVTAYIDPETAELLAFKFIPARQEGCRTFLLSGTEKERVLANMRSLSKTEIDEEGFVNIHK